MPRMDKLSNYRTTIMATNGRLSIVYVSTEIVLATPETITLDSGGYQTVTTKRKMNQASNQFGLGYGVYQRTGKWYVDLRNGAEGMPFVDGMTFPRAQPNKATKHDIQDRLRDEITNQGDC